MKKRNFTRNLIMMMAVVLLSALFCSCNAAGGAAGDETVSSSYSNNDNKEFGIASVSLILPEEMSIAVSADDNEVKNGQYITVEAGKSIALEIEASMVDAKYMWYVGAEKTSTEAAFNFETAHPGVYSIMAAASNGSVDSINFYIIVK